MLVAGAIFRAEPHQMTARSITAGVSGAPATTGVPYRVGRVQQQQALKAWSKQRMHAVSVWLRQSRRRSVTRRLYHVFAAL